MMAEHGFQGAIPDGGGRRGSGWILGPRTHAFIPLLSSWRSEVQPDRQTDRQSMASPPASCMEWGRDTLWLMWLGKGGVLVTQIPQPLSGASPVSTPRLWSMGNVPSWDKSCSGHPGSSLCAHPTLLAPRMRRGQGRESIQFKTTLLEK